MNVGDLVGIQWKPGIGYVGSKTGEYLGLIVYYCPEYKTYKVYMPKLKQTRSWGKTWLVRLSDEI